MCVHPPLITSYCICHQCNWTVQKFYPTDSGERITKYPRSYPESSDSKCIHSIEMEIQFFPFFVINEFRWTFDFFYVFEYNLKCIFHVLCVNGHHIEVLSHSPTLVKVQIQKWKILFSVIIFFVFCVQFMMVSILHHILQYGNSFFFLFWV